ncbi:hypothetical protein JKF63_03337 [Porcisia hertigi]|uniref:Diacylglycerol acyltransferase n=1 Tax=Porcisia hertigi TaxID=2761500 RepID=A0A836IS25_9TRYP|nr:hypothetical protein JKF63_03337 [Porcisia hertigi]
MLPSHLSTESGHSAPLAAPPLVSADSLPENSAWRRENRSVLQRRASNTTVLESQAHMSKFIDASSAFGFHSDRSLRGEPAAPFEVPHFSTVSLLIVWVVDCIVGLFSLLLSDVYADRYPEFPLMFFLALGLHLNLLACIFVYLLGREMYGPGVYHFYQPFAGGVRFVTLQCFGVTFVVSSMLLTVSYGLLFECETKHTHGFLSTIGVLALFGNILLLLSLRSFNYCDCATASAPDAGTAVTRTGAAFLASNGVSGFLGYLRHRPNAESALELVMLTAQCALSVASIRFTGIQKIVFVVNLAITLACGGLSLFVVGYKRSLGFLGFRLLMHRTFDTVLLWLSWVLYAVAVLANALLIIDASVHTATSSSVLAVEGLNVVSCVALLMFVRTVRFEAVVQMPSVPSSVFDLGGVVTVAAVFALACLNVSIFFYVQNYPDHLDEAVEGTSWTYQGVLVLVSQLAQLMSLLPTPMVYVSGVLFHGDQFHVLASNRSVETLPVLLQQAVSYLLYAAAITSFVLFLFNSSHSIASLEAVLSTLSVFCMTYSVRLYSSIMRKVEASRSASGLTSATSPLVNSGGAVSGCVDHSEKLHAGAAVPTPGDDNGTDLEEKLSRAYIMNGEMIVSYLLCLTNLVLRLLVDISLRHVWGEAGLPHERLILIANICFIVCVPLAHYSARDKGVQVFYPFSGSSSFVALQVLGWMLYAMFVIVVVSGTIVVSNSKSMPTEWNTLIEEGPVLYTLFGILELIPVVLITLSIMIEARYTMTAALQQRLAKESFLELRRFMREELADKSDERKAVAQVAFQTLMTAALHSFDIPCTNSLLRIYKEPAAGRRIRRGTREYCKGRSSDSSDGDSSEGGVNSEERSDSYPISAHLATRRRRQEVARLIVILLCCASGALFVIAALMANILILSLTFAVTAMIICTASCVGLHAGYGMVLHSELSAYVPFMPFRGGSAFVIRQMAGWGCFAGAFLVTLITVIESAEVSIIAMLIAALLSIASQVFIFSSVPLFSARSGEPLFLEVNGEGVVALLSFSCAIAVGRVYASVTAFFGPDTQHYLHYGDESRPSHRTRVPFVLAILAMSLAVPCTLIALSRTKRQWLYLIPRSPSPDTSSAQGNCSLMSDHHRGMWVTGIANLMEVLVILFGTITPLSIGSLVFYFFNHYTPHLLRVVEAYLPVCFALTALTLALSVVPHVINVGVPPFVVGVRVTVVTWVLYAMPACAVALLILPSILVPRHSTIFLTAVTFILSFGGDYKEVRLVVRFTVYAMIGYLTYVRCTLYPALSPSWAMARALGVHALDCALLGVWLWYIPLYRGSPSYTGSQRSVRFTEFARKYLFTDTVKYFSFRVLVDDPAVQLRDDTSQYVFSFHPHGVFPGTALFAALTEEWARKVGVHPRHYVSTHVASVVFKVPLIRDFNLRLGALSVGRRSLEASLKRGNSVVIVTGGQTEMLHTQLSVQRMTLITQHTGFIRLAIALRVPLVPLLCFAENNVLGLLQFPRIQRLSLKLLGFPFPTIPFGRFGLPVPFRTPLTLVVGPPLAIPEGADENNPEDVRRLSEAYFKSLKELFYRRRAEAGYADMELVLLNEVEKAQRSKQAREAAAVESSKTTKAA